MQEMIYLLAWAIDCCFLLGPSTTSMSVTSNGSTPFHLQLWLLTKLWDWLVCNTKIMKRKVFLLCIFSLVTLFAQGEVGGNILRSLGFAARMYYYGIEAAVFEDGSFVTYHTDDGYNSFVQDVEYSSDYSSTLVYYCNPYDADLHDYSYELVANVANFSGGRSSQDVDYSSFIEIDKDGIYNNAGTLYIPVKVTKENKEKIKYNPNHQILLFALKAHREASETDEENTVHSDKAGVMFSTHEEKPLDISFKGISWWDEEGDYSIDLPTYVFQVTEDKIDNIKDSIIISGNDGHPVNIHKVSTDAAGITKCCLSVEDSSKKIYGYTYINVKILPNTTAIYSSVYNNFGGKDSSVYNILGQKVDRVTKGLYVKKGKVFMKR